MSKVIEVTYEHKIYDQTNLRSDDVRGRRGNVGDPRPVGRQLKWTDFVSRWTLGSRRYSGGVGDRAGRHIPARRPIPLHFAAYTQPGKVLDPKRILVGSTSNFGEPLSDPTQLEGSFLSIDPTSTSLLAIPPDFAAGGGQASALGGFVQMYSTQNPAFLNSLNNPSAPTANFTGVSNPLGMSINNAFGRLWPANAPYSLLGIGSSTILDPLGEPLAGAPNPILIGGVYADGLTNRKPQVIVGGLYTGAIGTAFMGHSPDGSTKAVFAVVCADGSVVQEHTLRGLDGLAPPGTINPVLAGPWNRGGNNENHPQPRSGVLLNYSPSRILT